MRPAWQTSVPLLCSTGMLGLSVSRFRALMLLLAFGLGLAGEAASTAAMAAQMQGPQAGISTGAICPGCDADMQRGGLAPSCMSVFCSTIPALPAQSTGLERLPAAVFPASTDVVIAGIASAPDPRPPRIFLHS
jgi:hypothetical protein